MNAAKNWDPGIGVGSPRPGSHARYERVCEQAWVAISCWYELKQLKIAKKIVLLEKHKHKFADRKKLTKSLQAKKKISIEGKAMNGL